MSTETSKYDIAKINTTGYWRLVRQALRILRQDPSAVESLEADIRDCRPDEQLLFYHIEPLSIAAGIAEATPNKAQIDEYLLRREQLASNDKSALLEWLAEPVVKSSFVESSKLYTAEDG